MCVVEPVCFYSGFEKKRDRCANHRAVPLVPPLPRLRPFLDRDYSEPLVFAEKNQYGMPGLYRGCCSIERGRERGS